MPPTDSSNQDYNTEVTSNRIQTAEIAGLFLILVDTVGYAINMELLPPYGASKYCTNPLTKVTRTSDVSVQVDAEDMQACLDIRSTLDPNGARTRLPHFLKYESIKYPTDQWLATQNRERILAHHIENALNYSMERFYLGKPSGQTVTPIDLEDMLVRFNDESYIRQLVKVNTWVEPDEHIRFRTRAYSQKSEAHRRYEKGKWVSWVLNKMRGTNTIDLVSGKTLGYRPGPSGRPQ